MVRTLHRDCAAIHANQISSLPRPQNQDNQSLRTKREQIRPRGQQGLKACCGAHTPACHLHATRPGDQADDRGEAVSTGAVDRDERHDEDRQAIVSTGLVAAVRSCVPRLSRQLRPPFAKQPASSNRPCTGAGTRRDADYLLSSQAQTVAATFPPNGDSPHRAPIRGVGVITCRSLRAASPLLHAATPRGSHGTHQTSWSSP
ncbi:MAG: hypothetical protein ACI85K_001372 [Hyphomicrobiaceae bacterium]|jgi:hypothetical protein